MIHNTVILTCKETADWLREQDDILILTHRRPDGDTLGSAAGLCVGLRAIGKNAYLLENPETTPRYLKYVAPYLAPSNFVPGVMVIVDTADAGILAVNAPPNAEMADLCIDHHASNTGYAKYTCLDPTRASCGEVVYDILLFLTGEICAEMALPLYVALATDTGCFQYANVTENTLLVASKLIAAGADHWSVNKALFRTKSRARMALDGALYSGLQYHYEGQVAIAVVTLELLAQTGVTEDDLDDIAAIPTQAQGVKVGIIVRELEEGGCKISVRTTPGSNANIIAQKFGGGGHTMAAGCHIMAEPEVAAAALVTAAGEALG